jgi:hypothetical protein
MEKYYTPDIDEFHVGFECEVLLTQARSINDIEEVWMKMEMYESNSYVSQFVIGNAINSHTTVINILNELIKDKKVRVKYLDADDIKELGWKEELYKDIKTYINRYYRLFWFENNTVISIDCELHSNPHLIQVFRGSIKNKSELKVLMKQLNIV